MKNNKKKLTILVIQLLALVIFVFSYKSYSDAVVKPIKVYSFARNMEENTKISQTDLEVTEIASNSYKSNMILSSDLSSIIGRYTTTKVYKSTLCYKEQFGDLTESKNNFASLDLTNARLMSIPVDSVNDVGGYLSSGDRIDLLFSGAGTSTIVNVNSSNGDEESENTSESEEFFYSKVFLQDVIIYEVINSQGYKYAERATRYSGEQVTNLVITDDGEINADSGTISNIIIIVTPEQAEQIKTRMNVGSINILKRFEESETHDTLGYVLGNYGKVFSGNANAETGSLQIISTIQDTDNKTTNTNSNKNNSVETSANTSNTNENSSDTTNSSSGTNNNTGASAGGSSIE